MAGRGRGWVEPNPMVGAVIVQDGEIVAEGYHRRFGGPHAEIDALNRCVQEGVDPRGCDLFVTLEPCAHQGKTSPCAEALIQAGVARVYAAMIDPDPRVAGRGVERLRDANIPVEVGLGEHEARRLNEAYIKRVTTGRPWVVVKMAQTIDGRIATRDGDSRWVSNSDSRGVVHRMRARVDAVVVGVGTVAADDPELTARGVPLRRVARRVVVDPQLRISPDARLFKGGVGQEGSPPVTIAVASRLMKERPERLVALEARGVEFVGLPARDDEPARVMLGPLMRHLSQVHRATNVLVEGGAGLFGSLLHEGLVDQIVTFIAPTLLGDEQAVPLAGGLTCGSIRDGHRLELRRIKRLGHDVMLDYRVQHQP